MAIPILNNLLLNGNQLLDMRLEVLGADPASALSGRLIYNSAVKAVKFHDGTAWHALMAERSFYIGTTAVQGSSAPQALTGITDLTATGTMTAAGFKVSGGTSASVLTADGGTASISSLSVGSASGLASAVSLTIGSSAEKTFKNGGDKLTFTLAEIGVDGKYLPLTGGTLTGAVTLTGGSDDRYARVDSYGFRFFQPSNNGIATFYGLANPDDDENLFGFGLMGGRKAASYAWIGTEHNDNVVRVYTNGNVGIGHNLVPAYKLDVAGTLRATGLATFEGGIKIGDATITWDAANGMLKFDKGMYSTEQVAAGGKGTSGGGGTSYERLDSWADYTPAKAGDVLSAALGYELHTQVSDLMSGSATNLVVSGSGNAVASLSKSGTTLTAAMGSFAPLGADGKIPLSYLSDAITGQMVYGGTLGSGAVATLSTNAKSTLGTTAATITLTNDTAATTGYKANEGMYYIVSAAQTFAGLALGVGDWLVATADGWRKIDNTDSVTSVAGQTGAVTLAGMGLDTAVTSISASGNTLSWRNIAGSTGSFANTWRGIQNSLTSDSTTDSLAAAQGKALKGMVDAKPAYHSYTIAKGATSYSTTEDFTAMPAVTLYDASGNVVLTDIQCVSGTNKKKLTVTFASATATAMTLVAVGN